jgi:superfamily II DNA/RNA helicase
MILNKKNVLVASHTGSGKTLAYLLPIAQVLLLRTMLCICRSASSGVSSKLTPEFELL